MSGSKGVLLRHVYQRLLDHFGRQGWWPAETPFEVVIGAILTQQTNWRNAARAIENLKRRGLLEPRRLAEARVEEVEELVRVAGFYKEKARRIVEASRRIVEECGGDLQRLFEGRSTEELREMLLSWRGIGEETADDILLYAAGRLSFPVDKYTMRMIERLGLEERGYAEIKALFEESMPRDLEVYKEYHALIDALGKTYCRAKPRCDGCPLRDLCKWPGDREGKRKRGEVSPPSGRGRASSRQS